MIDENDIGAQFGEAMRKLETAAGESADGIAQLRDQLLALAETEET